MRARAVAVALGVGLLAPGAAQAYVCITTSCSGYCQKPVPYRLGKVSADLGDAQSEVELKLGFEAWTKVSCTSLQTQYGGRTDEAPGNGNGVVDWVESGWSGGSGTIGTTTIRGGRGCINSHMRLNAVNFKWVSGRPASRGEVNTFSIVGHEAGHFLGLGHSSAAGAIMRASYSGGVLTISPDDEMGICRIYPGSGGGAAPPTDGGAVSSPARDAGVAPDARPISQPTARDAAAAVDAPRSTGGSTPAPRDAAPAPAPAPTPAGSRADGQPCADNDDCRSDFCLLTDGRSVCSRLCRSNADCVSGFACRAAGGENVCVPIAPTSGDGGAAAAGSSKGESSGCAIGGARRSTGAVWLLLVAVALLARRRRARSV